VRPSEAPVIPPANKDSENDHKLKNDQDLPPSAFKILFFFHGIVSKIPTHFTVWIITSFIHHCQGFYTTLAVGEDLDLNVLPPFGSASVQHVILQ
jgi:hypothetical protein